MVSQSGRPTIALSSRDLGRVSSVEYIRFVTARFGLKKFDTDGATAASLTTSRVLRGEREEEIEPSDIDFVDAGNKTDLRDHHCIADAIIV